VKRFYGEAVTMGLGIALGAILLDRWVGEAGWLARISALLVVGGLLCLAQYGLLRLRRR
jgi:hypothetical protein